MAFKIAARTLLHLGAELISSDAVALYELIKNAFDAGSKRGVTIQVTVRIPTWPGDFPRRFDDLETSSSAQKLEQVRKDLLQQVDATSPGAEEVSEAITDARNIRQLRE